MTDEERYELVQLRKENAQRTLCEAKLMLDNSYWNGAVNRMYYACFYAVTALLIQHGIKAQTHSGVRQMLSLHFVKTGKLSPLNMRFYSDLFAARQDGDYDDFVYFDQEVTERLYPLCIDFIDTINKLIKETAL